MSFRALLLAGLAGTVLAAGCGGSSHSSSTSTSPSARNSSTGASGSAGSSTAASGLPPAVTSSPAAHKGTNVRVPATFTIGSGDSVSPSTVSSPAFIAVLLTVVSADGRGHRVQINTQTSSYSFLVPANGSSSVKLPGLKAGRYPLKVDGIARAALTIGGEPGP